MLSRQPLEVRNVIPRYVAGGGYAESFGEQWNRWRRVQLDSVTGKPISRKRMFEGSRWPERIVPCWNYTGLFDLDREQLVAWAVLDTFGCACCC